MTKVEHGGGIWSEAILAKRSQGQKDQHDAHFVISLARYLDLIVSREWPGHPITNSIAAGCLYKLQPSAARGPPQCGKINIIPALFRHS